jgi:hypothetical protein
MAGRRRARTGCVRRSVRRQPAPSLMGTPPAPRRVTFARSPSESPDPNVGRPCTVGAVDWPFRILRELRAGTAVSVVAAPIRLQGDGLLPTRARGHQCSVRECGQPPDRRHRLSFAADPPAHRTRDQLRARVAFAEPLERRLEHPLLPGAVGQLGDIRIPIEDRGAADGPRRHDAVDVDQRAQPIKISAVIGCLDARLGLDRGHRYRVVHTGVDRR